MSIRVPAQGWEPRKYQLPLLKYMSQTKRSLRAVVAWHRRAGKDLTCVNVMAIKSLQRVGTYWYVLPYANQARRIVWNGMTGEGKKFIDYFPKEIVEKKSEQEMRIHLKNGSVIQLMGSDDPDKMVGANPIGVVFSEYSISDPSAWQLINPILAENGGWALFNGTPRGENHFYKMLLKAKADGSWYSSHLSVRDTKVIPADVLRKARSELNNEARFQSEYMCSFKTPVEGAYYGSQINKAHKEKRILDNIAVDPLLPVYTGWDLGMDDATTIWFVQLFRNEVRVVNYYENSGEGLPHYARELHMWAAKRDVTYAKHFAPHDIKVRELGTGKSRIETARSLGLKFTTVKKLPVIDGIEAVRNLLPRCWFSKNDCYAGIEALKGYHKEFDSSKGVFRKSPVHDSNSHGADGFRTLAVGLKQPTMGKSKKVNHEYQVTNINW
jgi:phage terminase large subunit|tara:strand:+ start:2205 stop:3521 length:1317 start_codon:yes stop_codon:yes gene_type:complete